MHQRVVVGITGGTTLLYGSRALELLETTDYESHLILSAEARDAFDDDGRLSTVEASADAVHENRNIGAPPASGSFDTAGMLVAPCSSGTVANIANGATGTLITRVADVTLKERRPLVVMPTERPLSRIHLENMIAVTDAGGIVSPPFPSFYQQPKTVDDIVTRTVARSLTFFGVDVEYEEWTGVADHGA